METLKKLFETINRQSVVEPLSKLCRSFVETSTKLRQSFGPLWAHKGPILVNKLISLMKNDKDINKDIKIVNLGILKVKTWFGDKDL